MTPVRSTVFSRPVAATGSIVLALAVACSACSSSPSTPSTATLRQQFQAIVTKTDKALNRDRSASHPAQTYPKYAADFRQAATEFRALDFPSSMRHDAQALVAALDSLATDAVKVGKAAAKPQSVEANVVAMANLNLKLMEEEKTEQTLSNALRHDLGLPPATTTTTTVPSTQPSTLTPATTTAPTTVPTTTTP